MQHLAKNKLIVEMQKYTELSNYEGTVIQVSLSMDVS